jgi:hypothetical protein
LFLLSWILYPAVLAVLCLGCGLLADRLAGRSLPRALLLPVGFAAVIVLATLLTVLDATAELAAPAITAAALAGFGLALAGGRRAALRPSAAWLAPAAATGIAFGALAAPVVLTGQPGLTGFQRIVDIASQIDLASYLVDHGRSLAGVTRDSSYHVVADQLLQGGYPGGAQAALGATAQVSGLDVIWAWQPFMAWMAGMLALALYVLLGRAIPHRGARALAAGVAAQPTILYSYALTSGVKELAAAAIVALTAALVAAAPRPALPIGLALAAGLCAVNVGIAPWVLVLLAVAFGPPLLAVARRRERLHVGGRTWLLATAGVVLVAVPAIAAAIKLAPFLRAGGPADLGNLADPVPFWSTFGPWLTSDHRYALSLNGTETTTAILAAGAALLALAGVVAAVRRRDRGLYAAAAAGVIAVAFVVIQATAWVELKAFAITAPLAVALAFGGAAALHGAGLRRWAALAAGAGLAASILAGNLLVYRDEPLAPYPRFSELAELGERYAGQGPALQPSYDEYAGYLMRDAKLTVLSDVPPDAYLDPPAEDALVFTTDLDALRQDYLERFALLVLRRGDPGQSRPPSDWRLAERTAHYDVYRRAAKAPEVLSHHAGPRPDCEALGVDVRRAPSGTQIAYAPPAGGRLLPLPDDVLPPRWIASDDDRLARGPGRIPVDASVPAAGDYDVWIRGSFGRRVAVALDGRPLGALRWRENYPLHFEPLGRARLTAGRHRFEIVRGGGGLLPGTGNELGAEGIVTRIGPIALLPRDPGTRVRTVDTRAGQALCESGRQLDWIEVVRAR